MSGREGSGDFLVADRLRADATLDAMAARLHARLRSEVALVGIRRRGAPLAEELGKRLARVSGSSPAIGEIELTRYSDDLRLLHDRPPEESTCRAGSKTGPWSWSTTSCIRGGR